MKRNNLWIVMDSRAKSPGSALGLYAKLGRDGLEPCGTYFVAAFHLRRSAEETAAKWPGARVVAVELRAAEGREK